MLNKTVKISFGEFHNFNFRFDRFFQIIQSLIPIIAFSINEIPSIETNFSSSSFDFDSFLFISFGSVEECDLFCSYKNKIILIVLKSNVNIIDLCINRALTAAVSSLSFHRFWHHSILLINRRFYTLIIIFKATDQTTTINTPKTKHHCSGINVRTLKFWSNFNYVEQLIFIWNFNIWQTAHVDNGKSTVCCPNQKVRVIKSSSMRFCW